MSLSVRRLLREPFVHFAIIGVVLFGIDAYLRDESGVVAQDEIVVSAGRIDQLAAAFTKTWTRPPTERELRALIDDYVLDEALFREGVAMGIDQGDSVIRRRVRSKIEFFIDDLTNLEAVSDEVLETWLAEHPESYRVPARFTFQQVYFNPAQHGEAVSEVAEELLAALRVTDSDHDPRSLGDATMLPLTNTDLAADRVASTYGKPFADQLAQLPVGTWSGPVESAYGLHLAYLDTVTPGRLPALAEVREPVERDWRSAQRQSAVSEYHQEALDRYEISIEWAEFLEANMTEAVSETAPEPVPGPLPEEGDSAEIATHQTQPRGAAE